MVRTKFSEVEKTRELFLLILIGLQATLTGLRKRAETRKEPKTILKELDAALESANRLRNENREQRRAAYEEAKIYAIYGFDDKTSLFLSVPDEPIVELKLFTQSYCVYFELDMMYEHEIHWVLLACEDTVNVARSRVNKSGMLDKETRDLIKDDLEKLTTLIDFGINNLRRGWAAVSSASHKTIHSLVPIVRAVLFGSCGVGPAATRIPPSALAALSSGVSRCPVGVGAGRT